jgi:YHS domain-containing protein
MIDAGDRKSSRVARPFPAHTSSKAAGDPGSEVLGRRVWLGGEAKRVLVTDVGHLLAQLARGCGIVYSRWLRTILQGGPKLQRAGPRAAESSGLPRTRSVGAGIALCELAPVNNGRKPRSNPMKSILTSFCLAGLLFAAAPAVTAQAAEPSKTETTAPKVFTAPQKVGTKATCPVTGDQFTIAKDTVHAEYKGKHVYFCCGGCKKTFDKDPEKYTK